MFGSERNAKPSASAPAPVRHERPSMPPSSPGRDAADDSDAHGRLRVDDGRECYHARRRPTPSRPSASSRAPDGSGTAADHEVEEEMLPPRAVVSKTISRWRCGSGSAEEEEAPVVEERERVEARSRRRPRRRRWGRRCPSLRSVSEPKAAAASSGSRKEHEHPPRVRWSHFCRSRTDGRGRCSASKVRRHPPAGDGAHLDERRRVSLRARTPAAVGERIPGQRGSQQGRVGVVGGADEAVERCVVRTGREVEAVAGCRDRRVAGDGGGEPHLDGTDLLVIGVLAIEQDGRRGYGFDLAARPAGARAREAGAARQRVVVDAPVRDRASRDGAEAGRGGLRERVAAQREEAASATRGSDDVDRLGATAAAFRARLGSAVRDAVDVAALGKDVDAHRAVPERRRRRDHLGIAPADVPPVSSAAHCARGSAGATDLDVVTVSARRRLELRDGVERIGIGTVAADRLAAEPYAARVVAAAHEDAGVAALGVRLELEQRR